MDLPLPDIIIRSKISLACFAAGLSTREFGDGEQLEIYAGGGVWWGTNGEKLPEAVESVE